MLRINTGLSAAAAVSYFQVLDQVDHAYHLDGAEPPGMWGGRGAEMLGLSGAATRDPYTALANNRHPETGSPLTPRTKDERRAMYDFTFSVPKPVSLLHALVDPESVQAVFDQALARTMAEVEAAGATRVRRNGQNCDRITGNLVWASYVHRTTRPVNGRPDPHLHAHVCVFNQTFDPVEKRWKAVQIGDIKRNAPLYEALFLSHVAEGLEARGYRIEGDDKSWRVVGLPDSLVQKFSRRTQLIEKTAAALDITDPERKADLGRRTRERKGPPTPYGELRNQWSTQLTPEETAALDVLKRASRDPQQPVADAIKFESPATRRAEKPAPQHIQEEERRRPDPSQGQAPPERRRAEERPNAAQSGPVAELHITVKKLDAAARRAIDSVVATLLERESVVSEMKLIRTALVRHPGKVTSEQVLARLDEREDLIRREHRGVRQVTSRQALEEEQLMVKLARNGRGRCEPLSNTRLDAAEPNRMPAQRAVRHILTSGDRVMLVHGGTAERKTDVIREAALAAEKNGHFVSVFAPTADAARGHLRASGLSRSDTLAKLLSDEGHAARTRGAVWFIDDAQQLGNQQMTAVLGLSKKCGARVVLVGDVRQRQTFGRGEALRVLSDHAGLRPAGLREVFHQRGQYRGAAEALSTGHVMQAVQHLSDAGGLQVGPGEQRAREVAQHFIGALKRGRTTLAVAATRDERERISTEIRSRLKEEGVLGKGRTMEVLRPAGLNERERADSSHYERGMVIQFARGVRGIPKLGWNGFRAGERVTVLGRDPLGHVLVTGGGQLRTLPLRHSDRFEVYRKSEIEVAVGDTIRITRSGYFNGGPVRPKWDRNPIIDKLNVAYARKQSAKRLLDNGTLLRVQGFTRDGDIKVGRSRVIPRDFAHVDHGYCLSPHAARTRTPDELLVSMPSRSLADDAREQLRSALHRAQDRVTVFTDDRDVFIERLRQTRERPSATKVVEEGHSPRHEDPRAVLERVRLHREAANEARRRVRTRERDREAERA